MGKFNPEKGMVHNLDCSSLADVVLPEKWTLYFHFPSDTSSYETSLAPVFHVATCLQWAQLVHHIPPPHPGRKLFSSDREVTVYSFFRNDITPTWEDPLNTRGKTFTYSKGNMSVAEVINLWNTAICDCVRGAMPCTVNGIQFNVKFLCSFQRNIKLHVWCASNECDDEIISQLHTLWNRRFRHQERPRSS